MAKLTDKYTYYIREHQIPTSIFSTAHHFFPIGPTSTKKDGAPPIGELRLYRRSQNLRTYSIGAKKTSTPLPSRRVGMVAISSSGVPIVWNG